MTPTGELAASAVADAEWKRHTASEVVSEFRAAVLQLKADTLSWREVVIAFAIATRSKNLFDRCASALRKRLDVRFAELKKEAPAEWQLLQLAESLIPDDTAALGEVSAKLLNGAFGKKGLSEDKAFELLKKKKPSARRMVMARPPRPPQPLPRFSPEKFRELVAKGIITQAEYDGCLVPLPDAPTLALNVPPELDAAIERMTLQPAP